MTQIIGLCGKLQSGKSSGCRYIAAESMKKNGIVQRFSFREDGELVVPAVSNGEVYEGTLDLLSRERKFTEWAKNNLWPKVKIYNFADNLKKDCIKYFNVPEELAFGNKKAKDTKLDIKWGDLADIYYPAFKLTKQKKGAKVTVRDLLITHADWIRAVNPMAFVDSLMYEIEADRPELALIGDVRYINEVNAIRDRNGKVIKFTKIVETRNHSSETELDGIEESKFDLIVDNSEMTLEEKNNLLLAAIKEWGVV